MCETYIQEARRQERRSDDTRDAALFESTPKPEDEPDSSWVPKGSDMLTRMDHERLIKGFQEKQKECQDAIEHHEKQIDRLNTTSMDKSDLAIAVKGLIEIGQLPHCDAKLGPRMARKTLEQMS